MIESIQKSPVTTTLALSILGFALGLVTMTATLGVLTGDRGARIEHLETDMAWVKETILDAVRSCE